MKKTKKVQSPLLDKRSAEDIAKTKKISLIVGAALVVVLFAALAVVQKVTPDDSMLIPVLKKGVIYSLIAVSMNLLNGFTGLFSLGQAGFMLIGAYTYAILTIPVESRANIYLYYDGGIVKFALPFMLALVLAGVMAAIFAFLIGLPVLKLKTLQSRLSVSRKLSVPLYSTTSSDRLQTAPTFSANSPLRRVSFSTSPLSASVSQ